jgi:glycosyltransferase involved in cell wall biosynthesis
VTAQDVVVVNTLGGALRHYSAGLVAAIGASGGAVSIVHVDEPSVAGGSGLDWVRRYVAALWSARRTGARVIVTWPVLGHLDRLVMRLVLGRRVDSALIVHDPRPLVRARGYGERSRRVGAVARRVELVVHSAAAAEALAADCPDLVPVLLPHPVVPRAEVPRVRAADARPVVRVLGQFKPDRDLELLAEIGAQLGATHRLEIIGRRWPAVEGWSVTDEFVSEERLDDLMATADAVLVPYKRFFQSGIAIRSLELGTPAIGPAGSSIADLYPDDRYLASGSVASWCGAITAATSADSAAMRELAARADDVCRAAWSRWAEPPRVRAG